MYNEQIENLINIALADGELTEKEKQILFKKAEAAGIDLDEFEMVLESKLIEKQQTLKSVAPSVAAPKSDKFGDVRKCPSCAAILQSFQTKCDDCGHEFTNIDAVQSSQKLFDLLQAATLRNSKSLTDIEHQKNQRLESLSQKHNSDGALVKIFAGGSRGKNQEEEREDLIRELDQGRATIEKSIQKEKANIIKNFPVPNSKEDLLELLAMATSNSYDNDGYVGVEEEVWIQKTDQIYSKIQIVSSKDPEILEQATSMVVSLMKKLPSKYKNFTTFPDIMKGKISADLDNEKKRKWDNKVKVAKPYAIVAGALLLMLILSYLFHLPILTLISVIGIAITINRLLKVLKNDNELNF